MSGEMLTVVKGMAMPFKSLVVDRTVEYVRLIRNYDDNMNNLLHELNILCAKKLDIDGKVIEGKERLRVMTRETANWLRSVQELVEREEMKKLMKEDRVAEKAIKMMEHRVMKKLLKEDRDTFDIVVRLVKKKCNQETDDVEEDADYKKVAKIAREVINDIAEEFKKFMKREDAAIAAVKLLNNIDLEKLREDDDEIAKMLSKAEDINRKEVDHSDHDEEELLLKKNGEGVNPVHKNNVMVKEKVGIWRKTMGSLTDFLQDENFKKSLPDGAKIGLEVMDALSKSPGFEQIDHEKTKQYRYCGWCVIRFNGYRHRHDMSEIAETMVKAIKSVIVECPPGTITRLKRADELENISGEFMEGLESREKLVQKILTALNDDQVDFVGVYGMGGIGKTTLAKEVANKRARHLFDKRVVVEVSEAPNIKSIQDQIAEGINLSLDDVHTVGQRARKLYNGLKSEKKRKILIILDNVWKKLALDEVGIPRERTKDFCCKLLITARQKQICCDMDVNDAYIFNVGILEEQEALNLFEYKSQVKVNKGEYKAVIDRLLRKCGGLPLTIVATASTLRGKDLSTWHHFAMELEKPISSQVSNQYRETFSILETSYKFMEVDEKRMFFFLACLSDLDSTVFLDELMRYGIGLDLFQRVDNLSEAMKQTNDWIDELVSSSLLLKDDTDGQVRIHDIVRGSAIEFAQKGKDSMILVESIPQWMCTETISKCTTISLISGRGFSRLSGIEAPMLETLLLKVDDSSTTLPSNFFDGMTNLKVLSLSNMDFKEGLPQSMGQLKRLKTLHLEQCKLKDINLIGMLENLLVLSLRGSTMEELSDEIWKLCNLRLLDMGECKGNISIPANILYRLSCLEGLYMFNSFDDWKSMNIEANEGRACRNASISELNKLSRLNVLELEVPQLEQLPTLNDDQLVQQLGKFRIHVGGYSSSWYMGIWAEENGYRRVLRLNGVDKTQASQSRCLRALLKKTDCLKVNELTGELENNFVSLLDEEGFKDLKCFQVKDCDYLKYIVSSNNKYDESSAFTNLEILSLHCMRKLEVIFDGGRVSVGAFSNLQRLTLFLLPKLKYGLPLLPLNLVEIFIRCCDALKFIFIVPSEENAIPKEDKHFIQFLQLKSIHLDEVKILSGLLGGVVEPIDEVAQETQPLFHPKIKFPSLDSLNLSNNGTIVTLWSKACHVSSFQNLKVMNISFCHKLRSLGPPSLFAALVQLKELDITYCGMLQEVITMETEDNEVRERVIVFPRLEFLSVFRLPNLKNIYKGNYQLEFPVLEHLLLLDAERLTNFDGLENSTAIFSDKIKFPSLEKLELRNVSGEVVRLWNWSSSGTETGSISFNPVPKLKFLNLSKTLTSIPPFVSHNLSALDVSEFSIKTLFSTSSANGETLWTYPQLPKLNIVGVSKCDSLEVLFQNEDDAAAISLCQQLTEMMLNDIPKLKMIPLRLLKNLCFLDIEFLNLKYLFIWGGGQLQLLESLKISFCFNMNEIIMDELVGDGEDQVYIFPRLKALSLYCVNITRFASNPIAALHFPLLEAVKMRDCMSIQSFWSGPFRAPRLKQVVLSGCTNLSYFLTKNMNHDQELSSLESVDISDCRNLVSFSSETLAAPELRDVRIKDCRKMKWFFSNGGPNHDVILKYPTLESVDITDCPNMQSFSAGKFEAPKLSQLQVDNTNYSKRANDDLQLLLGDLTRIKN